MYRNILDVPIKTANDYPDRISHKIKDRKSVTEKTYTDLLNTIGALTAGFAHFGVSRKDHVGFFMNNRFEWIATDFAVMALGAITVPRGSDTTPKEVQFIYRHSDSKFLIVETLLQLKELHDLFEKEDWNLCEKIFVVDDGEHEKIPASIKSKVHFYSELLEIGIPAFKEDPALLNRLSDEIGIDDLLTIVYTSGTTGNPKGVMLTHGNFIQNVHANTPRLEVDPKKLECVVVMLPSWHVYERAFEYCATSVGMKVIYSNAGRFGADLISEKPHLLVTVPRIWESIYQKMLKAFSEMSSFKRNLLYFFIKINTDYLISDQYLHGSYISLKKRSTLRRGIAYLLHGLRRTFLFPGHKMASKLFVVFREKVGGRLRVASSAAGSLPRYLDELFNAFGITIVNAYGMTETAPGISSRTVGNNTFGSAGIPFDNTEIEIRRDDGSITDIGEKGIIFVRGPQMMIGYYKNPEATAKVLSEDGWLNTGDIGVRVENGEILIVGRLKDTIVLMGGENVEPEPIEEKMKESIYIDHAVVLGQDKKQLSAIVAVNEEELLKLAQELKLAEDELQLDGKDTFIHEDILSHLMKEVNGLISKEHGFKAFEFVSKILPVKNDFTVGKELTQTLKIKRKFIEDRYHNLVHQLHEDMKKRRKK